MILVECANASSGPEVSLSVIAALSRFAAFSGFESVFATELLIVIMIARQSERKETISDNLEP